MNWHCHFLITWLKKEKTEHSNMFHSFIFFCFCDPGHLQKDRVRDWVQSPCCVQGWAQLHLTPNTWRLFCQRGNIPSPVPVFPEIWPCGWSAHTVAAPCCAFGRGPCPSSPTLCLAPEGCVWGVCFRPTLHCLHVVRPSEVCELLVWPRLWQQFCLGDLTRQFSWHKTTVGHWNLCYMASRTVL